MIISAKDVSDAFAQGRVHSQRFFKNAGVTGDGQWQDWAYASGQPAYDARIGTALTMTPVIASRNDAIYFPDKSAGQERKLLGMRVYATASGVGQLSVESEVYDLLAVYPLIDGDSTDAQVMDNAATLPRYTSGSGVRAVLVNHIAPATVAGCVATIDYTGADDVARQMQVQTTTVGVGKSAWSLDAAGASRGELYLPDSIGIKQIDQITFVTPPGGLWAVYLVKPIQRIPWRGGEAAVTRTVMAEKCIACTDGFNFPTIEDGAHLGVFYMPNGSARTVALFGSMTFIWG
jgi:hypothetical protein